jgi:hypothetical protein
LRLRNSSARPAPRSKGAWQPLGGKVWVSAQEGGRSVPPRMHTTAGAVLCTPEEATGALVMWWCWTVLTQLLPAQLAVSHVWGYQQGPYGVFQGHPMHSMCTPQRCRALASNFVGSAHPRVQRCSARRRPLGTPLACIHAELYSLGQECSHRRHGTSDGTVAQSSPHARKPPWPWPCVPAVRFTPQDAAGPPWMQCQCTCTNCHRMTVPQSIDKQTVSTEKDMVFPDAMMGPGQYRRPSLACLVTPLAQTSWALAVSACHSSCHASCWLRQPTTGSRAAAT